MTAAAPVQPLSGIRVLDLTRLLPGPWATMLLADLGAEVVKVEHPGTGGDPARHAQPRYQGLERSESVYFCNNNRNKRSITLDLKVASERAEFLRLVPSFDVVVDSSRPGSADRLGVGYPVLRDLRPDLIYCALSGFGQTGPLADLAGHDLNIAGMSGLLMHGAGEAPAMPGVLMGDYAGSTMVVVAVMAALVDRSRHGRGAFIDVSMLDALVTWNTVQLTGAFAARVDPSAGGAVEGWGGNPRYGIYRTRDRKFVTVSLLEKKYWDAFCRLQGREDLINPDETPADRLTSHGARSASYRDFLERAFATRDRDDWVAELMARSIPVCPVFAPEELPGTSQARAREQFLSIRSEALGMEIPQLGFPFRMTLSDGVDAFALRRGPPAVGEANAEYRAQTLTTGDRVDVR